MMKHLNLLDTVLDFISEQGMYKELLDWHEMYGNDKEQLDRDLENRYEDL